MDSGDLPYLDFMRRARGRCGDIRRSLKIVALTATLIALALPADWLAAQNTGMWGGPTTIQANGTTVQMPLNRPVSRRSKLALNMDTRWANNYGYRPIAVKVTSPKPVTADRLITIRLHVRWWSRQSGVTTIEQDFELPTGATSATAIVSCPQYQLSTQMFWWDVWVDGVKDRDLSVDERTANTTMLGGISPTAGTLSCLVVGPENRKRTLTAPASQEFEFLSLPAADFPQRWIDYTCLDVVALSLDELTLMTKVNPQGLEATRRWVQAGGRLWVTDLGSELEKLSEASKLLQLHDSLLDADDQNDPEADEAAERQAVESGWRPVHFRRGDSSGQTVTFLNLITGQSRTETDPQEIDRLRNDSSYVITAQQFEPIEESRRRRMPRDSARWFVEQRSGLGAVRAFRETKDSLFAAPASATTITSMGAVTETFGAEGEIVSTTVDPTVQGEDARTTPLTAALRSTPRWQERHGMTPDDPNLDFAKLLVPGVGLAPVSEFQVLITLFVLLIGPANFWILKRTRRLHLLVLTVPLAALVTTAALFAYAVVSDGFGTTVRAHSFTTLDQTTGQAASWARLSYYSGFAPGEGLTMPSDVAMYPVIPGWNEAGVDTSVGIARELAWEDEQAKLKLGWLRSRTPTQYLAIRSGKSTHKLELLPAAGKLRATNELGANIEFVLALDKEQKLFVGENLAAGARTNLQPIARNDAIRRLRDLVVKNTPEAPDALAPGDSDFAVLQRRQQRQSFRRYGLNYGNERLGTNLAHGALSELAGLEGAPALQLPPGSYIAVTTTGVEVPLGISGAEELASFHVIVGMW